MDSYKKLNQEKMQLISNLSENGVAKLIDGTVKKYFNAYLNNDENNFNNTWIALKEIIVMFEDDYQTIYDYINYCMCKYAIMIVENTIKRDVELYAPFGVEFGSDMNMNSFSASVKRSLALRVDGTDKLNLRNLKDMCVVGVTVDEDIVELVDALCESFNVKEQQNHERIQEVLRKNGRLTESSGDVDG